MLLSPRLVGMRQHNGALYPGDWEPILEREQWEVLCAILQDPARYKDERGGLPKHLLSGMAFCGLCGTRLTVRIRYGNRRYYCPTTLPLGGFGRIQRVAEPLEHLITEAVFEAVESDLFKRLIAGEEADPTQMLDEQLARDRGLLDRLESKVAEELIKPSTARRNRAQVERRMANTRRWIARKRGGQIVGLAPRNLREVWPSLSLDRRRNIVKAVLMKVTVHPQPNSVVFDPGAIVVEWRI